MDPELLAKQIAAMQQQGASDADIQAYINQVAKPKNSGGASREWGAPAPTTRDKVDGFFRTANQGATLGFSDEITAALEAPFSDRSYTEIRDDERERVNAFRQSNPKTAFAAELGGGIVASAPLAVANAPLSLARAARIGGATGAVAGVGMSDGDVSDRALGGLVGGGVGAIGGAVVSQIPGIASGAADALHLRRAGGPARETPRQAAQRVLAARTAGQANARRIGGRRTGAIDMGAMLAPVDRVARAASPATVDDRANEKIIQQLFRDETNPEALRATINTARQGGVKPETVMDFAGENTRGLAMAAQMTPGRGKTIITEPLEERLRTQGVRAKADVQHGLRARGVDPTEEATRLEGIRDAAAEVDYPNAFRSHPTIQDRDILRTFAEVPQFRAAWNIAREYAQVQRDPVSGRRIPLPDLDDALEAGELPLRGIQYAKQALDRIVRGKADSRDGIDRGMAGALIEELEPMLARLDDVAPEWGTARRNYRANSEPIDALETGLNFNRMDPRNLQRTREGYTNPAASQALREGVNDAVARKIDDAGDLSNRTRAFAWDESDRQRLAAVAESPEAHEGLMRNVAREDRIARTRNDVVVGSRTTPAGMALQDMGEVAAFGRDMATSNVPGLAARIAGRLQTGNNERLAEALATKLVAGVNDPMDLDRLMGALETAMRRIDGRTQRQSVYTRGSGFIAGTQAARRRGQ